MLVREIAEILEQMGSSQCSRKLRECRTFGGGGAYGLHRNPSQFGCDRIGCTRGD